LKIKLAPGELGVPDGGGACNVELHGISGDGGGEERDEVAVRRRHGGVVLP
jgi:hypothetical protein